MKFKEENLIPLPVEIHQSADLYSYLIQQLLRCYYAIVKPEPHFKGTFMEFGRFVWIQDQSSIHKLYKAGFFGKGDLSRSEPTWFNRNVQQNKVSLEELTVERRRKRRNADIQSSDDTLKPHQILDFARNQDVETFQLDLYEAFFLSYATNSLSITSANGQMLTLQNCWTSFAKCNIRFNVNYAVYHYYRSLGWVPKNGSKFGVDFVLYQSGPSYRHADYAVVVVPLQHDKIESQKSWEWLLRINRICTQVKKTLVLCYVHTPYDISSYTNLSEYTIKEVIYKRWSPQKNRE